MVYLNPPLSLSLSLYMSMANLLLAAFRPAAAGDIFSHAMFKQQIQTLDVISILKSIWRPNFTFFGIFLLFIKPL